MHARFRRLSLCVPSSLWLGAVLLMIALPAASAVRAAEEKAAPKGQRVFTCGHSFHVFVYPLLSEMAKAAGIPDHEPVGLVGDRRLARHSALGSARGERTTPRPALQRGKVDVLTLSPIWLPDDGIDNFARLGLEHNPAIRISVQEFWMPNDTYRAEVSAGHAQEGGPQRHGDRRAAEASGPVRPATWATTSAALTASWARTCCSSCRSGRPPSPCGRRSSPARPPA